MIFVIITCSILYIILYSLLYYLYIEYKRDYNEIEDRLLQLEKQINKLEKHIDNYDNYIEAELRTAKLRMFFEDIKKENNTQEGCECDMPCGRKKGRGGKRK